MMDAPALSAKRQVLLGSLAITATLLVGSCGTIAPHRVQSDEMATMRAAEYEQQLLAIAAEYRDWKIVDSEVRYAPTLCRGPYPGYGRFSESTDDATHGRKLYYLYAKDRDGYLAMDERADAIGQAVVKETWRSEPRADSKFSMWRVDSESRRPDAEQDGIPHRAMELSELFVMFRANENELDTDEGWVYGTVTADGGRVTSVGRIASCMDCHQYAKRGRLFGLKSRGPAPASAF